MNARNGDRNGDFIRTKYLNGKPIPTRNQTNEEQFHNEIRMKRLYDMKIAKLSIMEGTLTIIFYVLTEKMGIEMIAEGQSKIKWHKFRPTSTKYIVNVIAIGFDLGLFCV